MLETNYLTRTESQAYKSQLFRSVLIASAAIPGAFPPVMIDVDVNGTAYQEMHVDGGAMSQVFIYPPSINLEQVAAERGVRRERILYVIRNARLDPAWANVERRTLSIAGRAISALIQTQGIGDLYKIYLSTQRDGIDYNLAYIPATFDAEHTCSPTAVKSLVGESIRFLALKCLFCVFTQDFEVINEFIDMGIYFAG